MKRLLGPVRLGLLNLDGLRGRFHLDPIEVQVKVFDQLQGTFRGAHILRIPAQRLNVNCHLEVILLLAHKRIVRVAKVESFVGIHAVVGRRPGIGSRTVRRQRYGLSLRFYLQILHGAVQQGAPGCLLKDRKPNTLIVGIQIEAAIFRAMTTLAKWSVAIR